MPIIILGILIVVGTVLIVVFRARSKKADALRLEEQAKRRNES